MFCFGTEINFFQTYPSFNIAIIENPHTDLDMAIAVDESVRIYNMFADERNKAVKDLVRYLEQVVFF